MIVLCWFQTAFVSAAASWFSIDASPSLNVAPQPPFFFQQNHPPSRLLKIAGLSQLGHFLMFVWAVYFDSRL